MSTVASRRPISANNIEVIERMVDTWKKKAVRDTSRDADLIILGFVGEEPVHQRENLFEGLEGVGTILFVNTENEMRIQQEPDDQPASGDTNERTIVEDGGDLLF